MSNELTEDAIVAAGSIFGWMHPDGKTERSRFEMVTVKPTARVAAALDNLEKHGYVEKMQLEGNGYYYVLHKSCEQYRRRVMSLTKKNGPLVIVEPIGDR